MKHLNKALLFVFTLTLYSQNFVKDLSNVVNQANLPTKSPPLTRIPASRIKDHSVVATLVRQLRAPGFSGWLV